MKKAAKRPRAPARRKAIPIAGQGSHWAQAIHGHALPHPQSWEAGFRRGFDQASIGMALVGLDGGWLRVNSALCEIVGYSEPELLATNFQQITHPEDLSADLAYVDKMLRGEIRSYEMEKRYLHKQGHAVWVWLGVSLIHASDGKPVFFFSQVKNISERKQAEAALRASDERFHAFLENSPNLIFIKDTEGRYLLVNKRFEKALGVSGEQLRGKKDEEVFPAEQAAAFRANDLRVLRMSAPMEFEEVARQKDGPHTSIVHKFPLFDAEGKVCAIAGIATDITERNQMELLLRQKHKMEAIGQLSGGLAHDFNNLLTVIQGNNDILSSFHEQGEAHRRSTEQIGKATDRATSLTRQLLAFSRMQVLQPKVMDANAVVQELSKMLPRLITEKVEFTFIPGADLGRVKADPGQIEQILLNLAVNARDAMPLGGRLVVETMNFIMDEEYVRWHPLAKPGPYVLLTVSDTGQGMDAETQSHIFEPFFTTKEQGKGTGMGLATVYGIVKQSGGFIWVYSEPGHGSTFKIYLPRVDEPVETTQPGGKDIATAAMRGAETLLVVEDEEDVRELVANFVRRCGYTVLEAMDGVEGLRVAEQHAGPIHLLLTDLVMPKMGGQELARQLARHRPGLKVLYLSGYSEYAADREGNTDWRGAYLQKPFAMDTLAQKIREVLGVVT